MPNSRKKWLVCVLLLADFLLSSCWPLNPSASVRLMIVNPVNGSSISGSSTRLLLRCVGACDDRAVNVTFSNGENLQVHTFGSEASIDIEDLPFGFNKVAVELLPVEASPLVPPGSAGFSDQVIFFAHPREDAIGQSMHDVNSLRLLPPSSPIIVGSTIHLSVLSDVALDPSLIESLSARVDGQIFGHSSPRMIIVDENHISIEGLVVETGTSTVYVLMAGQNIAGSPLPLLVQERVIPHTQSAPTYVDQASYYDRCWATIVTSPSFVLGAVALAHSLNPDNSSSAATKIALVTALLPAVDRCVLSAAGWLLRDVPVITNPNSGHVAHFSNVYSKLHVFALEGTCGRVVYLDADVVAVDPAAAGELFDVDLKGYALAASPEINPPAWFNSGVLVFDPSKSLHDEVFENAQSLQSYDKTDQGMLNELFVQRWKMLRFSPSLSFCNVLHFQFFEGYRCSR